jgi:hypothetical protein
MKKQPKLKNSDRIREQLNRKAKDKTRSFEIDLQRLVKYINVAELDQPTVNYSTF